MTGRSDSFVVACAADDGYALPLAVMLRSMTARLDPSLRADVYVVDDGISASHRSQVAASLGERCDLHWVEPRSAPLTALPTWGRMPLTTYQKLTLADWLPADATRAIWLDCDLLVRADVGRLARTEMEGFTLLAAADRLVPRLSSRFGVAAHRELGLPGDANYFNAGVMVIDLERWRREGVAGRAVDYLERFGERVVFWDQEALNVALAGRWGELDTRWNCNPTFDQLFPPVAPPASAEGLRAQREPWIVHFMGRLKPWTCPGASRFQEEFEARLDETAWAGWRPPRSWRGAALARYAGSPLRRRLFPLEQWWTSAARALTRR